MKFFGTGHKYHELILHLVRGVVRMIKVWSFALGNVIKMDLDYNIKRLALYFGTYTSLPNLQ